MKKIWIFMLCVLTFTAVNVTLSGANSAPANKNLLNPERLEYTVDLIGDVYEASVITALPIMSKRIHPTHSRCLQASEAMCSSL